MTRISDLEARRAVEQHRIRAMMTAQRAGERAKLKIGPEHVAWVKEEMCIGCDTTNRTRQTLAKEKGWPWLEGKSFRGSGVLGTWAPWDPRIMEIGLSLNGETKQLATTDLMVHSFDSIMEHLTNWYGLSPGDLIWTGTPEGVGAMKVGDKVDAWMKNPDGEKISFLSAECVL